MAAAAWNDVVTSLKHKNLRLKDTIAELQQEMDDLREANERPDGLATGGNGGDDGVLRHSRAGSLGNAGALEATGEDVATLRHRVQELEEQLQSAAPPEELARLAEEHNQQRAEQDEVVNKLLSTGTELEQELRETKAAEEEKVCGNDLAGVSTFRGCTFAWADFSPLSRCAHTHTSPPPAGSRVSVSTSSGSCFFSGPKRSRRRWTTSQSACSWRRRTGSAPQRRTPSR